MTRPCCRTTILAIALGGLATHCVADALWVSSAGGSFSDPGCWSLGAVPGVSSSAIFAIDVAGAVWLPGTSVVGAVSMPQGQLELDLNGNTLAATGVVQPSLSVASVGPASLTVGGGTLSPTSAEFASVAGAPAALTIAQGASVQVGLDMTFARAAYGSISFGPDASLKIGRNGFFGALPGSSALVTLDAPGATLECVRDLQLGIAGDSQAVVTNGAALRAEDLLLSMSQVSTSDLLVSGAGSRVETVFRLSAGAGYGADATITLEDGARGDCGFLILGEIGASVGRAFVRGAGSRLESEGPAYIGLRGHGELLAEQGARLASDFVWMGRYAGSSASVRLTGADTRWDVSRHLDLAVESGTAATLTIDSGATLTAGVVTIGEGGELVATGRIDADIVNEGGVVSPGAGGAGESLVGMLRVAGDYAQGDGGALRVSLAGPMIGQQDRLMVDGVASLGGALEVRFESGFAPAAGQAFAVVGAAAFEGEFDEVIVHDLPAELSSSTVVSGGYVRVYISRELPGGAGEVLPDLIDAIGFEVGLADGPRDVNGDGDVDIADLAALLRAVSH